MDVIADIAVQGVQMLLVFALAPLLTGFVRKIKARLQRRRGPSLLQPYRDRWQEFSPERQERLRHGVQRWQGMTPEEQQVLQQVLFELRMRFVEATKGEPRIVQP